MYFCCVKDKMKYSKIREILMDSLEYIADHLNECYFNLKIGNHVMAHMCYINNDLKKSFDNVTEFFSPFLAFDSK